MRLLILRHGIAEETSPTGKDSGRRLTKEGKEKISAIAKALRRFDLAPTAIVSSPLVRAIETANRVRDELGIESPIEVFEEFSPEGTPPEMVAALRRAACGEDLCMVGHLPSAANLVAALIGAPRDDAIELKKGGVAVIEFFGPIAIARGTLRLLLAPKVMT